MKSDLINNTGVSIEQSADGHHLQERQMQMVPICKAAWCLFVAAIFAFAVAPQVAFAGALTKPANNVGIVGWWKFDDGGGLSAFDSSGGNNTGTLTGMDGNTDWVTGKVATALDFNAAGFVDVGNAVSLNPSDVITVMAWIKPRSFGVGVATVVERLFGSSYLMYIDSTNSNFVFNIFGVDYLSDPIIITTNVWQHIAAVYDGLEIKFYVNGIFAGSYSASGSIGQDSNNVQIGNDSTQTSPFDGYIDDVRIFHRPLSQADIQQIIRGDKIMKQATTPNASGELAQGLVAWYTMDGKDINWTSGAVADKSGSGNTGYVVNMGTSSAPVDGRVGQALSFEGVTDAAVLIADPGTGSVLDFDTASQISISLWLKHDSQSTGLEGMLAKGSTNYGMEFYTDNTFNFFYRNAANTAWHIFRSSIPIVRNVWQHLVVTYTFGTGSSAVLYVNGSSTPGYWFNGDGNDPPYVDNGVIHIGRYSSNSELFRGALDDVRIYNHALSAAAINKLYNISRSTYQVTMTGGNTLESGLSGFWSFDGKTVNWGSGRVADASILGNHGYVFGFATGTAGIGGKVGQAFLFDGVNDFVDVVPSLGTVKTVSFWVSAGVTTQKIINLSGTANIELSGGTITATGVPSPTIYIDGAVSAVLPDSKWHHVIVTSSTGVTANAFEIGRTTAAYFTGMIDDVRTWDRVLTATEIAKLYQTSR